jgi:hypothetical protein
MPQIIQVFFSLYHGLFTWHPVYLAGAVGLWWIAEVDLLYACLLGAGFALQVYLVAAWPFWGQGDAFGGRMLISSAPILAIGLAQVVKRLRHVAWSWVAIPSAAVLLWNLAFFVQYRFGFIPMGSPITLRQLVCDKFTLPLQLWQRLLH